MDHTNGDTGFRNLSKKSYSALSGRICGKVCSLASSGKLPLIDSSTNCGHSKTIFRKHLLRYLLDLQTEVVKMFSSCFDCNTHRLSFMR